MKIARYIRTDTNNFYNHYGAYYGVMFLEFDNDLECHKWCKQELEKEIKHKEIVEIFMRKRNQTTNENLLMPPAQKYRITRAYPLKENRLEVRVEIMVNPFEGLE